MATRASSMMERKHQTHHGFTIKQPIENRLTLGYISCSNLVV
ncbi:hypothetical protein JCM19235_5710 [Vibrio maritimus]|uniref:Uncharacterized protein n=1 Tax=Vibrio maritimus TaxID=990268 RepID=A0A090RPG2_9VIBR|nr:hypothetical protein JCM19235_5710 [Vibrio maritimus]